MGEHVGIVRLLLICAPLAVQGQHNVETSPVIGNAESVTISLVQRSLSDEVLRLRYQIRNGSDDDVWVCLAMEDRGRYSYTARAVLNGAVLLVQRQLGTPPRSWENSPDGRYVRLRPGETRTETASFKLPLYIGTSLFDEAALRPPETATRLVLEIGHYEGRLPGRVRDAFTQRRTVWGEESVVPWDNRALREEKILQTVLDDVAIPYHEGRPRPSPIHLSPCKRIEVHFRKSPLEFLFPYTAQQALLNAEERQYVESLKDFVLTDKWDLMGVAYDASEAVEGAFFTESSAVDLTCHREDGSVISFTAYDDAYIVTPEGRVYRCLSGLTRLRMLTPRLHSLDLRVRCAANLKELWHRCCQYHPRLLPQAGNWCDAIAMGERPCPGAGKGRCHYAMNPNCQRNSSGDMVLLFETKAGWNQHGGPELFSLGNHDPRGGCVLLNGGTVLFVRTKRQLRQLRWQ